MNRRSFFKWLGVGTAAVVAAPGVISICDDPWCGSIAGEGIIPHDELHGICVDHAQPITECLEYADYADFSSFSTCSAIDEIVSNAAKELGERAGRDTAELRRLADESNDGFKFFDKRR